MDDGWKAVESLPRAGHGVEPEAVNGNGLPRTGYGGNGHHDDLFGPTVELVPGNDRQEDEAPEPQQSLFSWAEFMAEEPVKPRGRGGKAQPAGASLFAWAVEQEREEETVGAGR